MILVLIQNFYPQEYDFKKPEFDEDLHLSVKRVPFSNYTLNGVIDRIDSETEEKLYSIPFKIDFDKGRDEFQVTLKSSNKKLVISKEDILYLDINNAREEKDKFAIAIKNLNLLSNKYLRQSNYFTLQDVFAYTFSPNEERDISITQMLKEPGTLRYFITSEEDNTSYVELKNYNLYINYYADFSTGFIKGMTMVTSSSDDTEVERLTLFSSK